MVDRWWLVAGAGDGEGGGDEGEDEDEDNDDDGDDDDADFAVQGLGSRLGEWSFGRPNV